MPKGQVPNGGERQYLKRILPPLEFSYTDATIDSASDIAASAGPDSRR